MAWVYVLFGLIGVNLVFMTWNLVLFRQSYHRWRHVLLLDRLLAGICVEAILRQNLPTWKAWSGTMGEFEVQINANRHWPN